MSIQPADRPNILLFFTDQQRWESCVRIPLVACGPGSRGGKVVPELVSLIDLPPTILRAAGMDPPATFRDPATAAIRAELAERLKRRTAQAGEQVPIIHPAPAGWSPPRRVGRAPIRIGGCLSHTPAKRPRASAGPCARDVPVSMASRGGHILSPSAVTSCLC